MSPSNEYSGLISFKPDQNWFDLLAVQGTLKNLFQHHSLKASILWCSAFFMVQLSQPYVTTGKTIALIIRTSVSRVLSLLFMRSDIKALVFESLWKTSPRQQHFLMLHVVSSGNRSPRESCGPSDAEGVVLLRWGQFSKLIHPREPTFPYVQWLA